MERDEAEKLIAAYDDAQGALVVAVQHPKTSRYGVEEANQMINNALDKLLAALTNQPEGPTIKIVCKEPPFHEVWLNDLVVIAVVRNEGTVDIAGRWRKVEP